MRGGEAVVDRERALERGLGLRRAAGVHVEEPRQVLVLGALGHARDRRVDRDLRLAAPAHRVEDLGAEREHARVVGMVGDQRIEALRSPR